MGLFGGGKKEEAAAPQGAIASGDRLNTNDLTYALNLAVNLGKTPDPNDKDQVAGLFKIPFEIKRVLWDEWLSEKHHEQFEQFKKSDAYKKATAAMIHAFDMNGDGKITPKDFQIMYDQYFLKAVENNSDAIDKYLPFAGQLAFGFTVGLGLGALARNSYKGKYWIGGIGFCAYSGAQYLIQQNFVNKQVLETAFKTKVKELADANGDGVIDRKDLEELVQNRLQYVATKLGPGGIAPGAVGYASLALGFARGIRMI